MNLQQFVKNTLESMGLTATFEFIPFSQSRNKSEKYQSLNYRVTCLKNGKPFLTTDYSMGCGYAPKRPKSGAESAYYARTLDAEYIKMVCETGKVQKQAILPEIEDVYYSLVVDADVLNYSNFEDWARCFGYDTDSRKGEKVYRACLEIALALRNAIGEAGMSQLSEIYQDY